MNRNSSERNKRPEYTLNHNNTIQIRLMRWLVRRLTPSRWPGQDEPEPPREDIRKHSLWLGKTGELYASWWLRKNKGMVILQRNFRNSYQEIDIIARDGNYIVFIEVRTLTSDFLQSPSESIKQAKAENIRKAAQAWRKKHRKSGLWRIDIIGIVWPDTTKPPRKVDHWEKAL